MALFHVSTSTPTKAELLESWAPMQSWGPSPSDPLVALGSFHFDDPNGRVGMETHLMEAADALFQIPLTYRDAPLAEASASLVGTLEHSVLGTRWVYDGLHDDLYVSLLAAVSLTGQGQALGMAQFDGRWYAAPTTVQLRGGGGGIEPVPVDGFVAIGRDGDTVVMANDRFEMRIHRRPQVSSVPDIGLVATTRERPEPIVLTEINSIS